MVLPDSFKEIIQQNKLIRKLSDEEKPLIDIESIPGYDSNPDALNLDWQIERADETGLEFKLKY